MRAVRLAAVLVLALAALPGCLLVDFGDGPAAIRLVNETDRVLYYAAWERETSYRMDPVPAFPPDAVPLPALRPGASEVVHEVAGYEPGDDVVFLLYARRDGADRVTLERLLTVTAEALRREGGRVRVATL